MNYLDIGAIEYADDLHPDELGLVLAITREPPRPELRLIFADWLEERGRPENAHHRLAARCLALGKLEVWTPDIGSRFGPYWIRDWFKLVGRYKRGPIHLLLVADCQGASKFDLQYETPKGTPFHKGQSPVAFVPRHSWIYQGAPGTPWSNNIPFPRNHRARRVILPT